MRYKTTETYIPIKPCKRGHFERYVKSKCCLICSLLHYEKKSEYINSKSKKRYQENKEDILEKQHITRQLKLEKVMWSSAKARAKRKGLEFNIDVSDIVIPKYCPVFPEIELNHNKGRVSYNSPSLDRVDNTKGYVVGNIKVISSQANMLKRNGTVELFKRLIVYIESSSQEKN